MTMVLFKRLVLCSVSLVGGYVTFIIASNKIQYALKDEGKSKDSSSYIYLPEYAFTESFDSNLSKEKKVIPAYWKLFMLSKSKDIEIRHKAVELMSKTFFEKWQYITISQACNIDTAVGLARSLNADPKFFLPPFKYLNKIDSLKEMNEILTSIDDSHFDDCAKHLKKKVIIKATPSLLRYGSEWESDVEDPFELYHSQQKRRRVLKFIKVCLRTILHYSSISHVRDSIMEKGILKTLLKVQKNYKKDVKIESLIAQILANIALEEKYREIIFLTGWIGILSEWAKSPNVEVNVPAAKALANLDKDDIAHPIYENGIFLLTPFQRLSQNDVTADVIFVHGFRGGAFHTWRQHDIMKDAKISAAKDYTYCWPKDWLAADIPSLRMILIDFKTCLSSSSPCCFQGTESEAIDERATQIIQKLLLAKVGDKPVIWIAHSMGGLIVKKLLVEANRSQDEKIHSLAKNTIGIVFYSVPNTGSDLLWWMALATKCFTFFSTELSVLGSSILLSLHEQFKDFVTKYDTPVLSFGETEKTPINFFEFLLVPPDSADPGLGEFYELPTDHLSSCKPKTPYSSDYLKVLKFVLEINKKLPTSHKSKAKQRENVFEISKIMSLIP